MSMVRARSVRLLFTLLLLLFVPAPISVGAPAGTLAPRLLHGAASYPEVPLLDAAPNVGFWSGSTLGRAWSPPAFTEWQAAPTTFVVALAGHFTDSRDVNAMLSRIGMISTLSEVRYWSVADRQWETLFTRATGLAGPDSKTLRGDFSADEIRSGSDLYFLSNDNRLQKELVTRFRVREVGRERIAVEMTNVSALRWLTFTMVPAGDMQTLYFLDRQKDGSWQFYSVTRVLNASFLLSRLVGGSSYINRAVAMYRYIAGIPTDRDPPAAP